ncbi:hypothetical protein ACHAXR_000462, partial [Thalassiosira sp. AJA248-18]
MHWSRDLPRRLVVPSCSFILLLIISSATIAATSARPFIISSASVNSNRDNSCLVCINKIRGGSAPYESNPSYQNSPTLGEVDKDGFYHASFQSPLKQRPPPFTQLIGNYFADLHKVSPTLFNGTVGSLLLFLAWQFPTTSFVSTVLRNHFVCSHYSVIRKRRYHALILSAFSHASFGHIAVNMFAFLTFGRSVKQVMASHGLALWPFVFSAAIFGNLFFLLFDKGQGSCIGLSGVTLALLAFDSMVYPTKELRMVVYFIPISLPAYYLFLGLLGVSVLGML